METQPQYLDTDTLAFMTILEVQKFYDNEALIVFTDGSSVRVVATSDGDIEFYEGSAPV